MTTAPLLSIGIIFKNEERCLERCLKSLEPLRQAIPCEVVMADTGATDKSREIAERYADDLFDFAWVDDFSAARNAVMDRCTGKWFLTIDCDEWLDADISQLTAFVKGRKKADFAFVIQRNYFSPELEKGDQYGDFHALRMIRMSTGQRYHGAIHETWIHWEPVEFLGRTILHHDGYLFTDPKVAKNKSQRNLKLLREKLEKEPDSLRTLVQCIESGSGEEDFLDWIRHAMDVVRKGKSREMIFAGCAVRHAVEAAYARELPELEEWLTFAEEQFPRSIFTLVDVNAAAFLAAHNAKEWEKAIRYGEGYEKGIRLLRAARQPKEIADELCTSTIHRGSFDLERTLRIGLADAYIHNGQDEKALEQFAQMDGSTFSPQQVHIGVVALSQLHAQTKLDTAPAMTAFYEQINRKEPSEKKQAARRAAFDTIASAVFAEGYQETERAYERYWRPGYGLFLPLAGESEIGRAAKIMLEENPAAIGSILASVESWESLPVPAFEHALQAGTPFPLKEKALNVEILDGMAARLTGEGNLARKLALALPDGKEYPDAQSLYWAQSLVLAAVRTFDWQHCGEAAEPAAEETKARDIDAKAEEKPACTVEDGLALVRRFVQVESALLPQMYAPQALTEENAAFLPPMHRWGLYCIRAMEALDRGEPQKYLSILRKGLKACPGEKVMVQFLLDRFMEDARPKANPELLALAEKVRAVLAAYDPNDPAVQAIRESPVYKQVAWIIEPTHPGVPVQ